ncbi:MAG: hypothetical protein ABEI96_09260 [Haloarculaceae archaeon]
MDSDDVRSRRAFVTASATAATAALAGCVGWNPFGCDGMHQNVIRATPATIPDAAAPIRYDDLPAEQRDIADAAIDDEYRECDPVSDPLAAFFGRVQAALREQSTDDVTVYLVRDGQGYALYAQREDMVYSDE